MNIVIDANVVAGYYKESVLGINVGPDNDLTDTTIPLFARLGDLDVCYLDDGKIIESEWRGPVDREWFDAWFAELLISGKAQLIPAPVCLVLERRLFTSGFPRRRSRDMWYVRVCIGLLTVGHAVNIPLITEDIDFYDPSRKRGDSRTRRALLQTGSGPINRLLRREGVLVRAICNYP